jgi:hypothetical protein
MQWELLRKNSRFSHKVAVILKCNKTKYLDHILDLNYSSVSKERNAKSLISTKLSLIQSAQYAI